MFVNEFKEFLNNINLQHLSSEVKDKLNDIEEYPDHEQWKSINKVVFDEDIKNKLATHVNKEVGANIYIINNIDQSINNSNNNQSVTINNYIQPSDINFVKDIFENRPSWFIPDKWIPINIFYQKYVDFGLSKSRTKFAKDFKDILWSSKKRNPVNGIMEYRLINPIMAIETLEEDEDAKTNYIYLIREREFINANKEVYKIGKSKSECCRRVIAYPKGSEVIIIRKYENCDTGETKLLNIFRMNFIHRTDIGAEYFEGDVEDMVNFINNYDMVNDC